MNRKLNIIILLLILALGAFLRFYLLTDTPPGLYPDEAMNGNNALEAVATRDFKIFYPENNGREGLFINLQAISLAAFGATPWALRIVSAIIGTLTILGVYLAAKELFMKEDVIPAQAEIQEMKNWIPDRACPRLRSGVGNHKAWKSDPDASGIGLPRGEIIALLSAFFLATSYWHLNFSRIGFRAIMLPLIACFGMYFLLKGLRTGKITQLSVAGIFAGLGFYTYISYRFMVFAALAPIGWHLWEWRRSRKKKSSPLQQSATYNLQPRSSVPCGVALFLFITFITALPIGAYFIKNPGQFFNRAGGISVFSAASPIQELGWSTLKTARMFFWHGDCNWRHNYGCRPQLHPLVALFFVVGVLALIRKPTTYKLQTTTLTTWLLAMAVPAILTREGLPHALRAIGMIPPVMIFAAVGAESIGSLMLSYCEKQKSKWSEYAARLSRIQRELKILFIVSLLVIPLAAYRAYFIFWADHAETYAAFDTSSWHLGEFLGGVAPEIKKYVVVNALGAPVRGIPMPSQSVMFATDTFRDGSRAEKNLVYLTREQTDQIVLAPEARAIIAFIDGSDSALIRKIQKKYPFLQVKVPGDFVVLQNY